MHDSLVSVPAVIDGSAGAREVPALSALNAVLRDDYLADCQKGVERWNRMLEPVGASLSLPHVGFNRSVGAFAGTFVTPGGEVVPRDDWIARRDEWLPTEDDRLHVASLMQSVVEPGKIAGWLAPPASGIHAKPVDFEYVRM